MLSFFMECFKRNHRSDIPQAALVSELNIFREHLALTMDEVQDERTSASYLDEWADEGFLRKYYRNGADGPSYDLTPESEKVIGWIQELAAHRFVAAESRLLKVFELLNDIAYGAAYNPEERVSELERKKKELEAEIQRVKAGVAENLEPTAIRERYYELEDTARRLLADFRQIERNFRDLDRETRAQVIAADQGRGNLLRDIFKLRDAILSSDQGKTFEAFWAFVMSPQKQREFASLADRVLALDEVAELPKGLDMASFDRRLATAGARVQGTVHLLNEELRRFLDEKNRSEGRAVALLAEEIRKQALALRDNPPPDREFLCIEGDPDIDLVMERPLFHPEEKATISEAPEEAGSSKVDDSVLFEQDEVDIEALRRWLDDVLVERTQVPLASVLAQHPIEGGLAELLGYLSLASEKDAALIADDERTILRADDQRRAKRYRVDAPTVIYVKGGKR